MRTYTNNNCVPPFIAFGTYEKADMSSYSNATECYDYSSQKTIIPMFCGSDKKCTKSAKNVGSFLFPKYKNETDDAKEK
jgi:hypothetical protein